jgi:hypothetical protein
MLRPILLNVILLATPALHAQQVDWLLSETVEYGLNPALPGNHLSRGSGGHLFTTRPTMNITAYGQDVAGDITVERRDPLTGEILASCAISGKVTVVDLVADADGNLYIGGRHLEPMTLCDGTIHPFSGTLPRLFLMAFNADLEPQWIADKSDENPGYWYFGAVSVAPDGALWYAVNNFQHTRVHRVDAGGASVEDLLVMGAKVVGAMDHDPSGALYMSGGADHYQPVAFGNVQATPPFDYSKFVLRIEPDGVNGWVLFAADITFSKNRVVSDPQGNALVSGDVSNDHQWGNIPFIDPPWGSGVYLIKVSAGGEVLWGRQSVAPEGLGGQATIARHTPVAVDEAGHVFLSCGVRGTVTWGDGMITGNGINTMTSHTLVTFNPDGLPLWSVVGQPFGNATYPQSIAAGNEGELHFTAHVNGAYAVGGLDIPANGQQFILGRIGSGIPTGLGELHSHPVMIWPNPATVIVFVQIEGLVPVAAELLDASGRIVRTYQLVPGINPLDLTSVAPGTYLLRHPDGFDRLIVH